MSNNRISQSNSKLKFTLALIGIFLVIAASVLLFAKLNAERISEQNAEYLRSSSTQTVQSLSNKFQSSLSIVQSISQTYSDTLTSEKIDLASLISLLDKQHENYDFSNFVVATADGLGYSSATKNANVSSNEFYSQGMSGKSGFCYQEQSQLLNKSNLIAFYAPITFKTKVLGVICGFYDEDSISKMLKTSFFGETTSVFLCDSEGKILGESLTTTAFDTSSKNAVTVYREHATQNGVSAERLESAFSTRSFLYFTYQGNHGLSCANIMGIPNTNWCLLITFPSTITTDMADQSNKITMIAALIIGGAALLLGSLSLALFSRQHSRLVKENIKSAKIINASVNLFAGLVIVDLKTNTYQILQMALDTADLPQSGDYNMLRYFWRDLFFDDDKQMMDRILSIKGLQAALSGGTKYAKFEYRTLKNPKLRGDAETLSNLNWMQLYITPVDYDAHGAVSSVLLVIQDINRIKTKEIQQHKMIEEALVSAERASEAKSDFLNNMSHDIRTPLNSIMGLITIASVHVNEPAFIKDSLSKMQVASKHLLGLVNKVLDMAKIESGNFTLVEEEFSIKDSIEDLLAIIEPQIEDKNQTLILHVDDIEHDHVIGDPMRLQQVFVNIMSNSVKFTPDGGAITLSVAEVPSKLEKYACYRFDFSDTGCGMSDEFAEHVFEPFSRAHDTRVTKSEGTGLGMSIVKNVINMMNGNINVKSKVDEGTTFSITLHLKLNDKPKPELVADVVPVEKEEVPTLDIVSVTNNDISDSTVKITLEDNDADTDVEVAQNSVSHQTDSDVVEETSFKGRKVLLVEDNFLAAEITAELLELLDVEVDRAENGQIAAEKIESGNNYDLVFMDVQMPVMNGYEATRAIREFEETAGKHTPIVALTADAFIDDVNKALDAGMDAHLSKPVEAPTLIATMNKYFDE